MNIGSASNESGLPVKTIRYYEDIGLISPARSDNGYRHFNAVQMGRLHFLAQARHLEFTLEECRALLMLEDDPQRQSHDVRTLAQHNLEAVRAKIVKLRSLEERLTGLIGQCHGDTTSECAILDNLAQGVS